MQCDIGWHRPVLPVDNSLTGSRFYADIATPISREAANCRAVVAFRTVLYMPREPPVYDLSLPPDFQWSRVGRSAPMNETASSRLMPVASIR